MKKIIFIMAFSLGFVQAATIYVTTYDDINGSIDNKICSLRNAILAANTDTHIWGCSAGDSGIDTIKLQKGFYNVVSDLPRITDSLIIEGEGKDITIIQPKVYYPPSHYFYFRPATLSGKVFHLKGVTLEHGVKRVGTDGGGCISILGSHQVTLEHVKLLQYSFQQPTTGGGLLFVTASSQTNVIGELNLLWSDFLNNNFSPGIRSNGTFFDGGGLYLSGSIHFNMVNSSLRSNYSNEGGGIKLSVGDNPNNLISEIHILRSNISGNYAYPANINATTARGGGIYINGREGQLGDNHILVDIKHSNITDNGAINANGEGAGLYLNGTHIEVTLQNTMLFDNFFDEYNGYSPSAFDYYAGFNTLKSNGFNVIGPGFSFNNPTPWTDPTDPNPKHDHILPPPNVLYVYFLGFCPYEPYDYRGYGSTHGGRIVGGPVGASDGCDVGAFEYDAVPVVDYDGDGVLDVNDSFPLNASETLDTDNDNIGNNADTDDDDDGVLDIDDAFPLDETESLDTDGDGIGNNADTDDDNDGISDSDEASLGFDPLDASDGLADDDGDGFSNAMEFHTGTNINDATDKPIWTPILMNEIMIFVPSKPL